jgi:hypothetical protein
MKAREEMKTLNDVNSISLSGNLRKFESPTKHAPEIYSKFREVNEHIKQFDVVLGQEVTKYNKELVDSYTN